MAKGGGEPRNRYSMDYTTRILIGAAAIGFLIVYFLWKWRRAGQVMEASQAYAQEMSSYMAAMKQDPRWLRLAASLRGKYALAEPGTDPRAHEVHQVALVDDSGFMYRQHGGTPGATRVCALLVRSQPPEQVFVSMGLESGDLREDPAPYGWTYQGPLR